MKIINISGLHTTTKISAASSDYMVVPHTAASCITTVQSIILKAPKTKEIEFTIKTQWLGSVRDVVMEVAVPAGASKIINVKQQLPESVGMYVSASDSDGSVTVNGITIKLG